MSRLNPIQRYLGLTASKDPFAMLGVEPDACTEKAVLDALASRLALLVKHPHANSIEVEEVRLALHAAAAQLLDPVVREHLQSVSATPAGAPAQQAGVSHPPAPQGPDEAVLEFQDAALRLIHLSGGWNQHAVHRVSALAHAYGLQYEQVRQAFHRPRNGTATGVTAAGAPEPATFQARRRPKRRSPASTVIVVATVIGLIIVGALAAILPSVGVAPSDELPDSTQRDTRSGIAADDPSLRAEQRAAPEPDLDSQRPIVRRENLIAVLRDAVSTAEENPGEAAWRMEDATQWLGANWTSVSPEARDIAHAQVVAFLAIAAPGGSASLRVIDAITEGLSSEGGMRSTDDVSRFVWSAGATAQIVNAGGVSEQVTSALEQRLSEALPHAAGSRSFDGGAHAALSFTSDQITGSGAAPFRSREYEAIWRTWIACSGILEDAAIEGRALDASEKLLIRGPSPASEPAGRAAMTLLLEEIAWPVENATGDESAPGRRLLAWFEDDRISTAALAAVTEWLATNRPDSGVSFAMVLPRSAGPESRRSYRERFARAWSIGVASEADTIDARWVSEVRAMEGETGFGRDAGTTLALVLRMSQLSEARWQMNLGRRDVAARIVDSLGDGEGGVAGGDSADGSGVRNGNPQDDGRWALSFLSAPENASGRLAVLNLLDLSDDALGLVDAELLAEVALWGSPADVRRRATWLLLERVDQPRVVHAVLEALPRAPRNDATLDILENLTGRMLPDPDADNWEVESRRAVVDTLLEMVAGKGLLGALDAYQIAIAESYSARESLARDAIAERTNQPVLGAGLDLDEGGRPSRPDPLEAARSVARAWEAIASAGGLSGPVADQIQGVSRHRHARTQIAGSGLQRFVAEQSAIVELTAIVVQRERPESSGDVARVLAMWRGEQRAGDSVFAQMLSTEHAMLRLRFLQTGRALDRLIGTEAAVAESAVGGVS